MTDPLPAPGRTLMRGTFRLQGRRSARPNARRLALLPVVAAMIATTSATVVLEAFADQDKFGVPVHVETPDSDGCPAAHNHSFCQMARSLSSIATAAPGEAQATPATAGLVSLPSVPERGPSRLAFLTDCVVPRGPPLV